MRSWCGGGWVNAFPVEVGELDAVDLAKAVGMKAESGDETGGSGVFLCDDFLSIDGDADLSLPDPHFHVVPSMDVEGETREVVVLSIEEVIAELGVDGAGATGCGQCKVHQVMLAKDLGHHEGAGGISYFGHAYPGF